MKNTIIQNTENYLSKLEESEFILFIRYVGIIHEFMTNSLEKIYIQKKDYLKYILIKGINCISYIYRILLLYTNNLDLTLYHATKSFYYYIEFIGQVGDDSHAFLKLNSKDAYLFVLKKTIYEINQDFKLNFEEKENTKIKLSLMDDLINVYNCIVFNTLENFELTDENYTDLLKLITNNTYKIVELLIQLKGKDNKIIQEKIYIIENVIEKFIKLYNRGKTHSNILIYIENIVKKILKKNTSLKKIDAKFNDNFILENLETLTMGKFVNWLFEKK